jgi:hypothetical protein
MVAFLIMAYGLGWPILLAGHYFGLSLRLASSLLAVLLALSAY